MEADLEIEIQVVSGAMEKVEVEVVTVVMDGDLIEAVEYKML